MEEHKKDNTLTQSDCVLQLKNHNDDYMQSSDIQAYHPLLPQIFNGNDGQHFDKIFKNVPSFASLKEATHLNHMAMSSLAVPVYGLPVMKRTPQEENSANSVNGQATELPSNVFTNLMDIMQMQILQNPYIKLPMRMVISNPARRHSHQQPDLNSAFFSENNSENILSQNIQKLFTEPVNSENVMKLCKPNSGARIKSDGNHLTQISSNEQYNLLYGGKSSNSSDSTKEEDPLTPQNWLVKKYLASQVENNTTSIVKHVPGPYSLKDNKNTCLNSTLCSDILYSKPPENAREVTTFNNNFSFKENSEFNFKPETGNDEVSFSFQTTEETNRSKQAKRMKRKYKTSEDFILHAKKLKKLSLNDHGDDENNADLGPESAASAVFDISLHEELLYPGHGFEDSPMSQEDDISSHDSMYADMSPEEETIYRLMSDI